MASKEDYLKVCPAFGQDNEGKPGMDMSTQECQGCKEQDPRMWESCGKDRMMEQTEQKEMSEEVVEEVVEVKETKATETPPKPTESKPTRISIVADIVKTKKEFSIDQIVRATEEVFPGASEESTKANAYYLLNFAGAIGIIKKVGRGKYEKVK